MQVAAASAGLSPGNKDPFGTYLPYSECISVLLGPEAPDWIMAPSKDGPGKLQPHETSRVNWSKLGNMKEQVKIETELRKIGQLEPLQAKEAVASAWTMVAMASFMDPSIFQSESAPHISSLRGGNITISTGTGSHTIVNFWPRSLVRVVRCLKEVLQNDTLDACDMMWIASSLAEIRSVNERFEEKQISEDIGSGMFLSHRGKDSKRQLMDAVLNMDIRENVFLDCLSLPRRIVNRNFVFKSLVRSERVLIVETSNFSESDWCQKESSLSQILERLEFTKVTRVNNLDSALQALERCKVNNTRVNDADVQKGANDSHGKRADESWITIRVLRDIDYHGRQPNLYSAKEKGLSIECFTPIQQWLESAKRKDPDAPGMDGRTIASQVRSMYQALLTQLKSGWDNHGKNDYTCFFEAPMDLWAIATQLTIGALGLKSSVYNKMETRRRIDAANALTRDILSLIGESPEDGDVERRLVDCMVLMCAAVALELAGEDYCYVADNNGIQQLVDGIAFLQDGLLLIDAREQSSKRQVLLRLLVLMVVQNDIGSIGLLQNSQNPVHETYVDGASLDIMPCVTLHPGMEPLFPMLQMG